ncbi:MAG: hypothetical protein ACE14L_09380 [Terriglobales bacterium]
MKKLALLVAVLLAFSFSALAQGTSSSTTQTTESTTKTTKKSKKSGAMASETGAAESKEHAAGEAREHAASGAQHKLTGCLARSADGSGYTLTNSKYKNGVEVKSSEDLSAHVGHKVKLSGEWEKPGATFNATKMTHISDTCGAAAAGGKSGGKKGKTTGTPS